MTTIVIIFMLSLSFSLLLTPLARWFGMKFGALDMPGKRKTHLTPTPRTGGLAIFAVFLMVVALNKLWETYFGVLVPFDKRFGLFLLGAVIAFGIGMADDFHRLKPGIKFLFQILAASVAFFGGLQIGQIGLVTGGVSVHFFSYFITVFWFVLIINAMNLVDGMDGLAGGIAVFACLMVIMLCILRQNFFPATLFAAVAGGTLGFLRYNFKPASIFLGDGGSYFLGYAIAGLSLMASAKAEMGAVLLIPLLGLGIPVFDTIVAALRRFIRGKNMFAPDAEHIHHKLRKMGLTTEKVVWLLYAISFALCVVAIIVINFRDERAGFFLIFVGIGAIFFIRKIGYFEYFGGKKIFSWLQDVSDVTGVTKERRSFLSLQMDLNTSKDLEELWENLTRGMVMLGFDVGEMSLGRFEDRRRGTGDRRRRTEVSGQWSEVSGHPSEIRCAVTSELHGAGRLEDRRKRTGDRRQGMSCGGIVCERRWVRDDFDREKGLCEECLLKLELPLLKEKGKSLGTLWLVKDLKREPVTHYTLRRIEHLRRTLTATIIKLQNPPKKK